MSGKKQLFHYAGRNVRHYEPQGKEILIGDYYHDAKEFKDKPWTDEESILFRKKRKRVSLLTRARRLVG